MTLHRWSDGPCASAPAPALYGQSHIARHLLYALLDDDVANDKSASDALRSEYDRQAVAWTRWTAEQEDYLLPLHDLLERWPDIVGDGDTVLDVGVGTGQSLSATRERCQAVLALDVSWEMIRRVPRSPAVHAVQASVLQLPVRSGRVDVVLGLNAVPSWTEFSRVLAPKGRLVWVSSFGADTPIVVSPTAIADRFERSTVTWAKAGHGFWVVVEGGRCIR